MTDQARAGVPDYSLPIFVQERNVTCAVCPGCAFTFDESHTDVDESSGLTYTCPECGTRGRPDDN